MSKTTRTLKPGRLNTRGLANIAVVVIMLVMAVGAGFVGFMLGTRSGDQWQQQYIHFASQARVAQLYADSLEAEVRRTVSFADSVSAVAERQSDELARVRQQSVALRTENQALYESAMDAVREDPCNCEPLVVLAETLTAEIQENLREINLLHERDQMRQIEIQTVRTALVIQTARADSLAVVVANIPEPRGRTKIFGFLELNRKEAGLIGLAVGLVIGGIAL
jgi:hypothetical protein